MRARTGAGLCSVLMAMSMLLAVTIALAADVNGKWKADFETPDGQKATNTFTFKVDGEKVTGSVHSSISGAESPIEDGALKGDDLTFGLTRNFGGQEMKFRYTGKVKGDEIPLTVTGDIGGQSFEIQMTAKREK